MANDPSSVDAGWLLERGLAHHLEGRFEQAEILLQQILVSDPDHTDALHLIGVNAHRLGNIEAAQTHIAKALALRPDFAEALGQHGYSILEKNTERITFEPNDDGELGEFWRLASERGAEVRSLGRDLPSLEDAVIKAMEQARE